MAVPKIVINDRVQFEGALPEPQFLSKVLEAVTSGQAGGEMSIEGWVFIGLFVVYFAVMRWVLPRFGVST